MFSKRKNGKVDDDLLLRANIAQGIKILYFERNKLFYEENNHYQKLSETFEHITKNIRELQAKKPRMLVMESDHLGYEILTKEVADSIIDYLNFLLYLPPPTSIFSKWRKAVEIGRMRVPTITYILSSIINYKFPDYWKGKLGLYTDISAAIIEIINETSNSNKLIDITNKIKPKINESANNSKKLEYKEKIYEWIRLGLLV
ncbi:MAG: hypothetical protein QXL94_03015 [Candidatus Parvarchaeum sp.]